MCILSFNLLSMSFAHFKQYFFLLHFFVSSLVRSFVRRRCCQRCCCLCCCCCRYLIFFRSCSLICSLSFSVRFCLFLFHGHTLARLGAAQHGVCLFRIVSFGTVLTSSRPKSPVETIFDTIFTNITVLSSVSTISIFMFSFSLFEQKSISAQQIKGPQVNKLTVLC